MDLTQAKRLLSHIPENARVLDVGGGASPFPRADHVIDALAFDEAGAGSNGDAHRSLGVPIRFGHGSWTQADLCDRKPWPFPDKSFDFAICSHLLEDVRDPIWVCSEMSRVAKAGYIETPSRIEEQSRGVENPCYAGYCHHRWLVSKSGDALEFRHKPHLLHSINDAIVADLAPGRRINPRHAIVSLDWQGQIAAREVLEFNEKAMVQELCMFAREARRLEELTVSPPMPLSRRLRRHMFYRRLARAGR